MRRSWRTTSLPILAQRCMAIVLCLEVAVPGPLFAQLNDSSIERDRSVRMTIDEALARFVESNVDLLIARYGIDTAKAQQITAGLLPNPTLVLGTLSSFNKAVGGPRRSSSLNSTLLQVFETAGKRGYRIEGATWSAQSAEAMFTDTVRQLTLAVKDAYVQAQAARRHLALARDNRDRFKRILDVTTIRFKKGFIAEVDLLRIRVQILDFESDLIQAQQDLVSALNDLRLLLALPAGTALELTSDLDFRVIEPDLPTLHRTALDARPDLAVKRAMIGQRAAERKLAQAFRYPDPSFGPGGSIQGPTGPDNPQEVWLAFSVNLPVFNRNQGGIVQADVAWRAAEADLKKTVLGIQNEVDLAYRSLQQNREFIELYRTGVLEDSRETVSIIEKAYQVGGATLIDLLDAARTSAAIQLGYIQALTAYQHTISQLEHAVGRPVETLPPTANEPDRSPALRLTLEEAVALFLRHNLDLVMAQYDIEAAKGQHLTARLLPNPTLNLGTISSLNRQLGGPASTSSLWGNVQQLFELAGKRGYRIQSAEYGTRSAEAAFEDAIRQLTLAVKDAYFRAQAARQHLAVEQDNRDRFRRILEVNTIRFKKGFIAEVDLIRIRLQVVDFETAVIRAQRDLIAALNDLRMLLALPPIQGIELTTKIEFHPVDPDLPTLQQVALDSRPDIQAKQGVMAQRVADHKLAQAHRYPDPLFGPGARVQGPRGPDNPQQLELDFSTDLPVFNRNQGGIAQANVARQVAEAELHKTKLHVENEVQVAYRTLRQNRRLVELYQGAVLDDARASLAIMENAYQRGGATILDLLDTARTSAAIQLNYVDAVTAYQHSLYQLESAVGRPLSMIPAPHPSPPGSAAQTMHLSLDEALALFVKQNLDLLIAQYGIETAKGMEITARLFPNPNLTLGTYSSISKTVGGPARSTALWGNLQQLIETAGKRGYRIESAQWGTRSAEAAFEDAIRQLGLAVKDAYFRVQAARQHLTLAEENRDRFRRILDINAIRYQKGYIAGVDLIRVRLQVVDFDTTVIQSVQDLEAAVNDLRLLLAVPAQTDVRLQTPLEYAPVDTAIEDLQQWALSTRPDLRLKQFSAEQSRAELRLANALRYPDPTVGPGFSVQGPTGPDNPQMVAFGLSIPLLVFNRNQGGIAQAGVSMRAAEADVQKLRLQIHNEVQTGYDLLVHSRQLVDVYRRGVLDDARETLKILELAYQRGGSTILDLLDAARTEAATELAYVDALREYQRRIAQLESAVGGRFAMPRDGHMATAPRRSSP